ncbi:MAG: hypothetical protein JXB62_00645 [Pirellulales bacterium]|nr:hypothetical protein [Pirellulales bacterium]
MSAKERSKSAWGCLGCGGCLVVAVVILVLVAAVVFFTWSRGAARRAQAELALARQAGEPTSAEELELFYERTDDEQEMAQWWLQGALPLRGEAFTAAAGNLPIVGDGEGEIPPPGQPWPELQAADDFLGQYARPLQQLHEAAEADRPARYPIDFSQGFNARLDDIQALRAASRMLALEAHVRAHRGDAHGAALSIEAILALADSLKQEPLLISQLIRLALEGMGHEVFHRQLPTAGFSEEDLDRLQARLRAIDDSDGLQRAIIGERVMGIQAIEGPASAGAELPVSLPRFLVDDNLAYYLGYMRRIVAATKSPLPQARKQMEQIGQDLQQETGGRSPLAAPGRIMAASLVPAHSTVVNAAARGAATRRASDVMIAVERFRRAHGRLPESLAKLVPEYLPEVPADPFDGLPLRYAVREGQYIIYSVGKDGVDNGGEGDESGDPDWVFPFQRRTSEKEDMPALP